MDKLRAMRAFVAIVDAGSLTRAARRLKTSSPTMVRLLSGLEDELGVRLMNRTTRRLALTDEGREYFAHCRRLLADLDGAERSLAERGSVPRGRVIVTASVPFGRIHVAPLIAEYLLAQPGVAVELRLLDRVVDLTAEGVDLAVRLGRLPDSSLIAVPVGHTERVVCGSFAYLERHGAPKRPEDLARHGCIRYLNGGVAEDFLLRHRKGNQRTEVAGAFDTNQLEVAIDACSRGVGLGQFLKYQVESLLAAGTLRRVLTAYEPEPVPIHVVYPHARLVAARVRLLVEFLVARLKPALKLRDDEAELRRHRDA